jgi:hypothetical protein
LADRSALDIRSFRGAGCDTDHYLVVERCMERLRGSKQAAQEFDMQRFDLKMLNDVEVRGQHQVKISNRFAAFENMDDNVDTSIGPGKIFERI